MTIPWIQAKLLLYYIQAQVAFFEMQNGKIKIPQDLVPAEIPEPTEEVKQNPQVKEYVEFLKTLRNEFISKL